MKMHAADLAIESLRNSVDIAGRGYTSDLSVDEAILLDETGFEPCGMVTGSTIFHIGYSSLFGGALGNQEIHQISEAMKHARNIAMREILDGTREVNGYGVVGMRLQMRMVHGSHMAEFLAVGTAIRPKRNAKVPTVPNIFTSDLTGKDFYLLFRAGYMPMNLVTGNCVYHVQRRSIGQWFSQVNQNIELENFTKALYNAREIAMTRLEDDVVRLGADGVVGMHIHEQSHVWGSHVIEFLALGTAIRRYTDQHQPLGVNAVVPL